MQWEQTTLPTASEPGYGERVLPATEFAKQDGEGRPTLVWFYSLDDERENRTCEGTVLQNEQVGLALKKFRCVKIDVESIDDARLRKEYSRTPAFLIIDPKGETIGKIEGKSATSLSRFNGMVRSAWGRLFTVAQKPYVKDMTKILDRLDRVSSQKIVLAAKKQRAEAKGQRSKMAAIAREEQSLKDAETEIQKDEREILAKCDLRDTYKQKDQVAAR